MSRELTKDVMVGAGKRKKKWSTASKIIAAVVFVIVVVVVGIVIRYTSSFNNFLDKITAKTPEMKSYSVVVLNNSEIQQVAGLAGKSVGFLKIDEKAGNAEKYLEDIVRISPEFYDDVDTLTGVLNGKIVDAITIETDRLEMLKDDANDTIKDTRVIYDFKIEIESENAEIAEKEVTKEPFVIYISGSDSRTGIKTTARSDVNIVAVVNPSKGKILLVSIPRDTYVQLHGTTGIRDKLTHAGVYGINMSKTTIEDFLGVSIDYTVKVSFDTVVKVVDQIDGIEIDSDQAMTLGSEDGTKCSYVVGKQQVNGKCALRFARERKSYTTGDRHRGENQMQVITAIISKLTSARNYLFNIPTILDIAADSFETSFTRDDIVSFIKMQIAGGTKWQVESVSVTGTGSMQGTYSMGASRPLYVMLADPASVAEVTAKINEYLTNK